MAFVSAFRTFALCLVPCAFFITACAHPPFLVPTGPGEPAPDATTAWTEATADCREIRTWSAELRIAGRVAEVSQRRSTILGGLTADDQIRFELPAPIGRPVFVLAGTGASARLVLRDNRVLVAPAEDIIEALVGLKLRPRALLALLSGCPGQAREATNGVRYGDVLAVTTADGRVYVRKYAARWRVVAAETSGLSVDYRVTADRWPVELRIASAPGRTPVIALTVSVRQIEVNASLPATVFDLAAPAGATPLTIAELRSMGPLGDRR